MSEFAGPPHTSVSRTQSQFEGETFPIAIPLGPKASEDELLQFLGEEWQITQQNWRQFSSCKTTDPEAFFPEKGGSSKQAKAICAACIVRHECLVEALETGEQFGIWGGVSERERRRMRKNLNAAREDDAS